MKEGEKRGKGLGEKIKRKREKRKRDTQEHQVFLAVAMSLPCNPQYLAMTGPFWCPLLTLTGHCLQAGGGGRLWGSATTPGLLLPATPGPEEAAVASAWVPFSQSGSKGAWPEKKKTTLVRHNLWVFLELALTWFTLHWDKNFPLHYVLKTTATSVLRFHAISPLRDTRIGETGTDVVNEQNQHPT